MLVNLKDLKPNPLRDFRIDPIDPKHVETLKQSIKNHEFWPGVQCRKVNGELQIACGHHRVAAAIKAGLTKGDVFVRDMDDAELIKTYAAENATQRGDSSTAQTGTVAAAVRYLAKAVLSNHDDVPRILGTSQKGLEIVRGQLTSNKGLGIDIIVKFLESVPNISTYTVQKQLTNLKTSGNYARIIQEVVKEIEAEDKERTRAARQAEKERLAAEAAEREAKAAKDKEAEKEAKERKAEAEKKEKEFADLARAKAAAEAANKEKRVFDFEGVSAHFENAHQIDVFRECVLSKGIQPYLPVDKQAQLAAHLVQLAEERNVKITAAFIRDNIADLVLLAKDRGRKLTQEERDQLATEKWEDKAKDLQDAATKAARSFVSSVTKLAEHCKERPNKQCSLLVTGPFREAITQLSKALKAVEKII